LPSMPKAEQPRITVKWAQTRVGPVRVTWLGERVMRVDLNRRVRGVRPDQRLAGELEAVRKGGAVPKGLEIIERRVPEFSRRVLEVCAEIGPGMVKTYGELAKAVGRPGAARAVGQVLRHNPFPMLVPCHRVVGTDGRLSGFSGGLRLKERLLALEGWRFEGRGRARRIIR